MMKVKIEVYKNIFPFSKLLFMPLDGDFKAAQAAIGGVCFEGVFVRRHPWYYMLAQISFAG